VIFLGAAGTPEQARKWLNQGAFTKLTEDQRQFVLDNPEAFTVRDPDLFPEGRLEVHKKGFTEKFHAFAAASVSGESEE